MFNKFFRCPFHKKANKDKTILNVVLGEDKINRVKAIKNGIEDFYKNPEIPALCLKLPDSVLANCKSLEHLAFRVLPYQCEIIASELDIRLKPFLGYQMLPIGQEAVQFLGEQHPKEFTIGMVFFEAMLQMDLRPAQSISELSEQIEGLLTPLLMQGRKSLNLGQYMMIMAGGIDIAHENHPDVVQDPIRNKNLFSIVCSPFYPKEFGRYSNDVRIYLTRQADFAKMNKEERRKIRFDSNSVLKEAGVKIQDLYEDKQFDGVWIPEWMSKEVLQELDAS